MPFMEIGEKLREILMFTDGVFRTRLDQMIDRVIALNRHEQV